MGPLLPYLLVCLIVSIDGYFTWDRDLGFICGRSRCQTEIQCDGCVYPRPFVDQVSLARAVLTRVENLIQNIGRDIMTVQGGIKVANSIPPEIMTGWTSKCLILANDVRSAIDTLSFGMNHQVVGGISGDVISDLSDALSVLLKLVGWCRSVTYGAPQTPMPRPVIIRYMQPQDWNVQCTGGWPCRVLSPYASSAQTSQFVSNNGYAYSNAHNRGNTQILRSEYDQGNAMGYGNFGTGMQNMNYLQRSQLMGSRSMKHKKDKSKLKKHTFE